VIGVFHMSRPNMSEHQEYQIGLVHRSYEDPRRRAWDSDRARPLRTAIWYPASPGAEFRHHRVSIFKTGKYSVGAKLSTQMEKFPLVIVSHGTGGSWVSTAWICNRLARQGFIVAALNHHGNTAAEPSLMLEGFMLWWERASDISAILDVLEVDAVFGPRIAREKIGVVGYSLGGYTALASVGVQLEIERWSSFSHENPKDPISSLPPESRYSIRDVWKAMENNSKIQESWKNANSNFREKRVRCAFAIAPVASPLFMRESLAAVDVPVGLLVGSHDTQSLPEQVRSNISDMILNSKLHILQEVGHYTFISEGTFLGRQIAPALLKDRRRINRHEIHNQVAQHVIEAFERCFEQKATH